METWMEFVFKHISAIAVVSLMSTILLKYVWGGKRKSKNLGTKSVLVVNCQSIVGWECARKLDKLGFYVFAGFLDADCEDALRLRSRTSSRMTIVKIDVTNDRIIEDAFSFIRKNLAPGSKGLYCLVNNSQTFIQGDFDWYTWEQCQKIIDVNFLGTIRTIKYFLPLLKEEKGRIVNICSCFGKYAYPQLSLFSSTNAALWKFFECFNYEVKDLGMKLILVEETTLSSSVDNNFEQEFEKMREKMTEENKLLYSEKLNIFQQKCQKEKVGNAKICKDKVKLLLNTLEESILNENPQFCYRAVSYTFKIRLLHLLNILPDYLKQNLIWLLFYTKSNSKQSDT